MKRVYFCAVLAVMSMTGAAAAQAEHASVAAYLDADGLQVGGQGAIAVVVDVPDGLHVQSHKPLEDYLVKFAVSVHPPAQVTAAEPNYPAGKIETYPNLGKLSIYSGRVIVQVPLRVHADAATGPATISGRVTLQACDDSTCFMPETLDFSLETRIVASDATTRPANLEYFKTAAATEPTTEPATQAAAGPTAAKGPEGGAINRSGRRFFWSIFVIVAAGCIFLVVRAMQLSKSPRGVIVAVVIAALLSWLTFWIVRPLAYVPSGNGNAEIPWQAYDAAAFAQARQAGRLIIAEFTANWCPNCQYLEVTVFRDPRIAKSIADHQVTAFRADIDNAPAHELLTQLNSSGGIPLTAVFGAHSDRPIKLSSIYTSDNLLEAIDKAAAGGGGEEGQSLDFFGLRISLGGNAYLTAFAIAFFVGILFNLMPCVFPVLPLKIYGFYETAQHNRGRCFALGSVFSLGVVASFAVLAMLVLVFKSLTWGSQFNNPWFVGAVVVVLVAMALAMFGAFSVLLPARLYDLAPKHDTYTGNFLMGIVATILSTPCTAPMFVGLMAWAGAQTHVVGVSLLLTVGLGMAFPYLLLSGFPNLARRLPRGGPWGEVVKQFMGFLLLAVAAYFAAAKFAA